MKTTLDFPRPLASVDVVIFCVVDDELQVLLVTRGEEPFKGRLALPGGFIDEETDEDLEACALRKLHEKTGIRSPYLEQLGAWGGRRRDPRGWSVTNVYFALIPTTAAEKLAAGGNALDARWHPVAAPGLARSLAFDHGSILQTALGRLRGKVEYTSLPAFLLPERFTLTELQRIYEMILGRPLDKKTFRNRIQDHDLVVPTGEFRKSSNRPAELYKLKSRRSPVFFAANL